MKAKTILCLSILIPFAMVFAYVWTTATDLVFRDDMYFIKGGFIESFLRGNLSFADLWRPTNSMRVLGGTFIYIADIKWFAMNLRLVALTIPFMIMTSALLIYRNYRQSLIPERSQEFIAATYFIISLIIFNIIQWEGLIYGGSIGFQYPMPFIIAGFISLELFLLKGGLKYFLAVFLIIPLALLAFGGRLCFVFVPTLVFVFLCYLLTRHFRLTKDLWLRVLIISALLAAVVFIYIFRIDYNDYVMSPSYHKNDVFIILSHPLEALKFIFASFGSSVIGIDAFFACNYFSPDSIVFIGLIIVLLYVLAIILFFKSRMYERTYLPLLLIIQTFFYLGSMMIGRFKLGGMDYGMSSRYTCISIYGLAALSWIFIFILARPERPNVLLKSAIYAGFAFIFSGIILTSAVIWSRVPAQNTFFERLHNIALRVETATPEELSYFAERPEVARDSLLLLREYKLNVYREHPDGATQP